MWTEWVKERGTNPPTFCPLDREQEAVIVGMNYVGSEAGRKVVGEFWYDENFDLQIEFYEENSDANQQT